MSPGKSPPKGTPRNVSGWLDHDATGSAPLAAFFAKAGGATHTVANATQPATFMSLTNPPYYFYCVERASVAIIRVPQMEIQNMRLDSETPLWNQYHAT